MHVLSKPRTVLLALAGLIAALALASSAQTASAAQNVCGDFRADAFSNIYCGYNTNIGTVQVTSISQAGAETTSSVCATIFSINNAQIYPYTCDNIRPGFASAGYPLTNGKAVGRNSTGGAHWIRINYLTQ